MLTRLKISIFCTLLCFCHESLQQVAPIVSTTLGKIEGSILKSQSGENIYAYRGIKYAKAPVGNLRFTAPVAVPAWNGTLNATQDSLVCPQTGIKLFMSEDCLALNVFSRNLTQKAPVIVYIHGGANVLGSGHSAYEAGPQYLLDHDIVFVAFNYRLGALGFLSTGTDEARGNYGYLDQVLALRWVKDHISSFGGDPNLVTIFGLSAGSMAVSLHLTSPLSVGLFHRAIMMSGSATNAFSIDNQAWTRKLAREVSCPIYNPKDVVDCLKMKNWEDIIDACARWEPYKFVNMKWNYEIDKQFLATHPTNAIADGNFHRVPILVGFTRDELDFTTHHQENNTGLLNDINLNFDKYAPELFLYDGSRSDSNYTSKRIKDFYLGNNGNISKQTIEVFGEMFSDAIIGDGVHRLVQYAQRHTSVYYYRFDYVGNRSLYNDAQGKPRGVGHADDLQYVLPGSWYGSQFENTHPDIFMMKRMTKWWATFAKDGIPASEFAGQWKATKYNETYVLHNSINTTLVDRHPYLDRYGLWDELFPDDAVSGSAHVQLATAIMLFLATVKVFL